MSGQKYTDTDVRHNKDEYEYIVLGYLENYQGNFEPLLELKALGGVTDFTVQQTRMVLNCMLVDANVVNMPRFPRKFYDAQQRKYIAAVPQTLDDIGEFESPEIETTGWPREVAYRPPWVDMKSRWNYPLGISTYKSASVVHTVDTRSPAVRWYPHTETLKLHLRWMCKGSERLGSAELLTYAQANDLIDNDNWRPCKRCALLKEIEEERRALAGDRESK